MPTSATAPAASEDAGCLGEDVDEVAAAAAAIAAATAAVEAAAQNWPTVPTVVPTENGEVVVEGAADDAAAPNGEAP